MRPPQHGHGGCGSGVCSGWSAANRTSFLTMSSGVIATMICLMRRWRRRAGLMRGNKARSRNARLAAVKPFFRYLEHRVPAVLDQAFRVHAIPMKKIDETLVASLSRAEVRALHDASDRRTTSGIDHPRRWPRRRRVGASRADGLLARGPSSAFPRERTCGLGKAFVDDAIMISERPPAVEDRAIPRHWEGVSSWACTAAIGTLVERSSRCTMLLHLPRQEGYQWG